jgi:IS605 OrfB family transposase
VFQPERLPEKSMYGAGEFSQDARGRWYLCISVESNEEISTAKGEVGIDLGLKDIVVLSNGQRVSNERNYRLLERRLKRAQQSKKKRLARTIHAKIKNKRSDQLHKASTKIVKENQLIVVGNLKVKNLTKTKMAKSVNDAGLSMFKTMLKYKASAHKRWYVEVNEAFTTRTCSNCGVIPDSSPKGLKGLSIREWVCSNCNSIHDRDKNAAINILRLGQQTLVPEVV